MGVIDIGSNSDLIKISLIMKNRIIFNAFFCIFSWSASSPSFCQWTQANGPFGAGFWSIAASGSTVLAATQDGIFRTVDSGKTWSRSGSGIPANLHPDCLLVTNPYIFAGTIGGGIYRSSNAGVTWSECNGAALATVNGIASLGTTLAAATEQGIYLSSDTGANWVLENNGIPTSYIYTLVASGTNLFAANLFENVYLSSDSGKSWRLVNSGLPTKAEFLTLTASGANVFLGCSDGIYRTTDQGEFWMPANNGIPSSTLIYALAANHQNVFAGSFGAGIFQSSDSGQSWVAIDSGLTDSSVVALTADGSELWAGMNDGGLFFAGNNGDTWSNLSSGLLANPAVNVFSGSGENILCGTSNYGTVFLSEDAGMDWTRANLRLEDSYSEVLSLALQGNSVFAGTFGEGIFHSTDGGENWITVNNGLMVNTDITALAFDGTTLFAGTGVGLYLSTDNGASWNSSSDLSYIGVNALVVTDGNILAGTYGNGIYISYDEGQLWFPSDSGFNSLPWEGNCPTVNTFVVSGHDVFAGTSDSGIFRSSDEGMHWTPVSTGLTSTDVLSLASVASDLFAGTMNGVFLSTNNGTNWSDVSDGLTDSAVSAIGSDGPYLIAGTLADGVWRRLLSDFPVSRVSYGITTDSNLNVSVFPNPASNVLHISASEPIHAELFDLLGRERANSVPEASGSNIEVSSLEAGNYLLKIGGKTWPVTIIH